MATVTELAKRCGKSETAIRQWCKRNHVSKDGKTYIINESIESAILAYYHAEVSKKGFECSELSEDATQLSKDPEGTAESISEVMNVSEDSELAELRASNVALKEQVESLTYQIETATFERDALNAEIDRLCTERDGLREKFDQANAELAQLKVEDARKGRKIEEYADKLAQLSDKLAQLTDQAQKLQAMTVQTRPKWRLPWHRRDDNGNQG